MQQIEFCGNLSCVTPPPNNTLRPPDPTELLEHSRHLGRLARSLAGNEASAGDLVQDTMRVAIERKAPIFNIRAFLTGTLRRLALRELRTASRRQRREQLVAHQQQQPSPDELIERLDLLRVVLEELRALPMAQQRTLTLHFLSECTIADIAHTDSISQSTVRSNLSRGIQQLRARLDRRLGSRAAWTPIFALPAATPLAPPTTNPIPKLLTAPGTIAMSNATIAFAAVSIVAFGAWLWMDSGDQEPTFARSSSAHQKVAQERTPTRETDTPTREAITPRAPSITTAPIDRSQPTGSVVDKHTAEPVPLFALWLQAQGSKVAMTTNEDGNFHASESLAHGDVRLGFASGSASMPIDWQRQAIAFPLHDPLQVEIGPTFTFANQFANSLDVSKLRASLHEVASSDIEAPSSLRTKVHGGDRAWVRFPFDAALLAWQGPFELKVRDRAGYWLGTARVERTLGIEPTPVFLDVAATGVAQIELKGVNRNYMTFYHATVTRKNDGRQWRRLLRTKTLPGQTRDGSHMTHLLPGSYSWSLTVGDEQRSGNFTVAANETTTVGVDASQTQETFTTVVHIHDPSGELDCANAMVSVRDPRKRDASFNATATRVEANGPGSWAIQLENIAAHTWTLSLGQAISHLLFEPNNIQIGPDIVPPVIEVKGRGPLAKMQTHIVSAITGESLPLGEVSYWIPGGGGGGPGHRADGLLGTYEIPCNMTSRAYAWAPGYRLATRDIRPEQDGNEVTFELRPGWGTCVRVWLDGDRLSGATVLVDGEVIGVTDALGTLRIERDTAPESVIVRAEGFTIKPPPSGENGRQPQLSAFGLNFAATRID